MEKTTVATALNRRLGHASSGLLQVKRLKPVTKAGARISATEELWDSWQRCTVEHRIDPDARTAPQIITESEIRVSREPVGDIIFCAQEEINRLYAIVRQQDYVVLLCNTDGVAVHHRGDEKNAEQFKYWGIWEGGVWSEEIEGTNGIGTCIAEERPVSVHCGQHFRERHAQLSCAGVPIFDSRGVLAAVLDTSTMSPERSDRSHALALAATTVAAREIEERLFRESFHRAWTIAAVPCDESGPAVLLAVDNDQRIVGADRLARRAFALEEKNLNEGVHLSVFFEYDRLLFRSKNEQDIPARFTRAGGGPWHVLISPPASKLKAWNNATPTRPRIGMLGTLPIPLSPSPYRGGLPPVLAQRIYEYIDLHLGEKITLDRLAGMAGLSVDHFAHAFRQSAGLPPHSYLLRRRVETAQHMLQHSELSLSQVALAAGFSDYSHLARHFRRLIGMSPRALRLNQRSP